MRDLVKLVLPGMVFFYFLVFSAHLGITADEKYQFKLEEFEPKDFEWGGYAEIKWERFNFNTEGAFYHLNYYKDPRGGLDRFAGALQLESLYKKGIGAFNLILHAEASQDDVGWSDTVDVYEGNLSLKPNPFVTVDFGKKVFKWGKGYAWNPVGFINRLKDPTNPEEALEGYIGAGVDLIKSFSGPLQTVALTTVALPVWEGINEDFGEIHNVNLAAKLYFLYRDTDIDFIVFNGNSLSPRYGMDFSRNLASNFEIHGEFAYIPEVQRNLLTEAETLIKKESSAVKYLLGLRYLTESDITTIVEFYHNGVGFSETELHRFYELVADADSQLRNTGIDTLFQTAKSVSQKGYSGSQVGRNYLYMKINQKDPFDILYFTPGLIAILNLDDHSYSISPEMLYTGFTNWELRLRFTCLTGGHFAEFEEKQNENKLELRVRYHF